MSAGLALLAGVIYLAVRPTEPTTATAAHSPERDITCRYATGEVATLHAAQCPDGSTEAIDGTRATSGDSRTHICRVGDTAQVRVLPRDTPCSAPNLQCVAPGGSPFVANASVCPNGSAVVPPGGLPPAHVCVSGANRFEIGMSEFCTSLHNLPTDAPPLTSECRVANGDHFATATNEDCHGRTEQPPSPPVSEVAEPEPPATHHRHHHTPAPRAEPSNYVGGRNCSRGCPCGNSCIPCSHRCRH